MNILKPNFVIVGGRCYRQMHAVDQSNDDVGSCKKSAPTTSCFDTPDLYSDEPPCGAVVAGEQEEKAEDDLDIKYNGREYSTTVNVPFAYYGSIIGKGGATLKRIEQETEARVKVPFAGASGPVVISAGTVRAIHAAISRIDVLIESSKKRFKATHFISIPVNDENVKKSFKEFSERAKRECGMSEQIFQKPDRLHLTIGLLLLNDGVELTAAVDELNKFKDELVKPLLGGKPLNVQICGLEYMNDDPSCVDVVYAKVKSGDQSDSLQKLADGLVEHFKACGLLHTGSGPSSVSDHVKLHITLMNSIFRQSPDDVSIASQKRPADRRTAFNASKVLNMLGSFDFGPIKISEIHISKRGEYNPATGYYRSEAAVTIP